MSHLSRMIDAMKTAGMEAAIVCAERGHSVTLYEKSDRLGGVFIAAAAPSFKEKDKALISWYRRELTKYPIEVKLNTEVTDIHSLGADEIIIAPGAKANRIPVPGFDKGIEACDFLLGKKDVGENVVIIGGGLTGCEIAYELYLQGKKPVIVETDSQGPYREGSSESSIVSQPWFVELGNGLLIQGGRLAVLEDYSDDRTVSFPVPFAFDTTAKAASGISVSPSACQAPRYLSAIALNCSRSN